MTTERDGATDLEKRLDDILLEYEAGAKMGVNGTPVESFESYAQLRSDQLDKMSPESCDEASLELMQHSLFVQRRLNRERARVNWCDAYINNAVSRVWNNYDKYLPRDVRTAVIAEENPALKKVLALRAAASTAQLALENLPQMITTYSNKFEAYARSKRFNK